MKEGYYFTLVNLTKNKRSCIQYTTPNDIDYFSWITSISDLEGELIYIEDESYKPKL